MDNKMDTLTKELMEIEIERQESKIDAETKERLEIAEKELENDEIAMEIKLQTQ